MSITASSANNIGSELLNTDELKTPIAGKKLGSSNKYRAREKNKNKTTPLLLAERLELEITA